MNTAIINIKVEPKVKVRVQAIADELGLSVSGIINAYLKQLIRTKKLELYLKKDSEAPEVVEERQQAEVDIQAEQDAIAWLNEIMNDEELRNEEIQKKEENTN